MSTHDIDNLFFIHNFKTLGTTIHAQLPKSYNKRFYGHVQWSKYEKRNGFKVNRGNKSICEHLNINTDGRASIDHIHLDSLLELGILQHKDIYARKCIMLVREPIERFLSICNYRKISPDALSTKLRSNEGAGFRQCSYIQTKHDWNITVYKTTSHDLIVDFFKQFGVNLDFKKVRNASVQTYTMQDLSDEDTEFLKLFYEQDYDLFEKSS
jgi:hypothetical protein